MEVVAIAAGGAIGALLRFSVSHLSTKFFASNYPWATFIVNIIGAFIIGFFWGFFERVEVSKHLKQFTLVGLIGSFTTFSTLSLDTIKLIQGCQTKAALTYLGVTNFLGLSMVILGYLSAQKIHKLVLA